MYARHEKPCRFEKGQRIGANEREVQVARARTIGVEGGAILPAAAGHRAATQHHGRSKGCDAVNLAQKGVEQLLVPAEREPDDIVALLSFRQSTLNLFGRRTVIAHASSYIKQRAVV